MVIVAVVATIVAGTTVVATMKAAVAVVVRVAVARSPKRLPPVSSPAPRARPPKTRVRRARNNADGHVVHSRVRPSEDAPQDAEYDAAGLTPAAFVYRTCEPVPEIARTTQIVHFQ